MDKKTPKKPVESGFSGQSRKAGRAPIVLASGSARRQEMLQFLGIPFESCVSAIDESWESERGAEVTAIELARRKIAACNRPARLVIAMDTVVVLDGKILGKPVDEAEAKRMLRSLSGRSHLVITGVALGSGKRVVAGSETTRVDFRDLSEEEIAWYAQSGEPYDKAGGYGIQGLARLFVSSIDGCFYNVVGFPITCFQRLLSRFGMSIYDLMEKTSG